MNRVKIGVFLGNEEVVSKGWEEVKKVACESERLGYDSLWLGDHLTRGTYRPECWTVLTALAVLTKRIRLGSLVTCNQFRHPPVLAKMAATLDVISDGRLEFGIGTGWYEDEHLAYGLPYPKPRIRAEMLDESVEIIRRMWTEEKPSFEGKYYRIRGAVCEPKPVQKPHPPITIGGGGERYLLRLVAKHADRWNSLVSVDDYRKRLGILRRYCSENRRNLETIEKSYFSDLVGIYDDEEQLTRDMMNLHTKRGEQPAFKDWFKGIKERSILGTAEQCAIKMRKYIDLGVSYFMLRFLEPLGKRDELKIFIKDVMEKLAF